MNCPACERSVKNVIDSRSLERGSVTRRRRECECGHRFTTYERVENPMETAAIGEALKHLRRECRKLLELLGDEP